MIINELYNGSGLGNQLWRYTVTRAIALNNGYEFGIMNHKKFKAPNIMNLDFGKEVVGGSGPEGGPPTALPEGIERYYQEKSLIHPVYNCDCRLYDHDLANVPDNTKIDGNMESEKYLEGRKEEVKEWLKIKEDKQIYDFKKDDICILGFRGGEYIGIRDLFLPRAYWKKAMQIMLSRNPKMRFVVVTDDPRSARQFFPNQIPVYHFDTETDWVLVRNAKNIIMSNTSFAWLATWVNDEVLNVIAPKYWGKYNVSDGFWAQGDSLTKNWEYLGRDGDLYSYEECKKEKEQYELDHTDMYSIYRKQNEI
jgi:hypothetical protein